MRKKMQRVILFFVFYVLLNEVSSKAAINRDHLTNRKAALAKQLGHHPPKWTELASTTKNSKNKSKSLINLLKVVSAKEIEVPDDKTVGNITINNATLSFEVKNDAKETKLQTTVSKSATNNVYNGTVVGTVTGVLNNKTNTYGTNLSGIIGDKRNATTLTQLQGSKSNNIFDVKRKTFPKVEPTQAKPQWRYPANDTLIGKLVSMKLNGTAEKSKLPDITAPTMIPIFRPIQTSPRSVLQPLSDELIRHESRSENQNPQQIPNNQDSSVNNLNLLQNNDNQNLLNTVPSENGGPVDSNSLTSLNKNIDVMDYTTKYTNNFALPENNKTLLEYIDNSKNNPVNNGMLEALTAAKDLNITPKEFLQQQMDSYKNGYIYQEQYKFNPINSNFNQIGLQQSRMNISENSEVSPNIYISPSGINFAQNGFVANNFVQSPNGYVSDVIPKPIEKISPNTHTNPNSVNLVENQVKAAVAEPNPISLYTSNVIPSPNVLSQANNMNLDQTIFSQNNIMSDQGNIPGSNDINVYPNTMYPGLNTFGVSNFNTDQNSLNSSVTNIINKNGLGLNSMSLRQTECTTVSYPEQTGIRPQTVQLSRPVNNLPIPIKTDVSPVSSNTDQSRLSQSIISSGQNSLNYNQAPNDMKTRANYIPSCFNSLNSNFEKTIANQNVNNKVVSENNNRLNPMNPVSFQQLSNPIDVQKGLKRTLLLQSSLSPDNSHSIPNVPNRLNTQFLSEKVPNEKRIIQQADLYNQRAESQSKMKPTIKATGFNIPCMKASDILGELYQPIEHPKVNSVTETPKLKLQCEKPILIEDEKDDDAVAIVFKPKNISLLKFYGDLLKKITLTVLVPYHISKLTS